MILDIDLINKINESEIIYEIDYDGNKYAIKMLREYNKDGRAISDNALLYLNNQNEYLSPVGEVYRELQWTDNYCDITMWYDYSYFENPIFQNYDIFEIAMDVIENTFNRKSFSINKDDILLPSNYIGILYDDIYLSSIRYNEPVLWKSGTVFTVKRSFPSKVCHIQFEHNQNINPQNETISHEDWYINSIEYPLFD